MLQYFLGRYPKTLLYTTNPKNRFKPIGDLSGSGIACTASYGSVLFSNINEDPLSPDTSQYVEVSPVAGVSNGYLNVDITPLPSAFNNDLHEAHLRLVAAIISGNTINLNISAHQSYVNSTIISGGLTTYDILLPSYNGLATTINQISLGIQSTLGTTQIRIYAMDLIFMPKLSISVGFFLQLCGV